MGACPHVAGHGGCGKCHPPIDLLPDAFPEDLPWEEVVVLPPGALEGRESARWRALLQMHASLDPQAAVAAATAVAVKAAQQLLAEVSPAKGSGRSAGGARAQRAQQEAPAEAPPAKGPSQEPRKKKAGVTRPQHAVVDRRWDLSWICDCGQDAQGDFCKACGLVGPCRY
jgi:hypothetical protein